MERPVWEMLTVAPGTIAVVSVGDRVGRILFRSTPEDAAKELFDHIPDARDGSTNRTKETLKQLAEYFNGQRQAFQVPMADDSLTPFSRRVHKALCEVPYGSVVSYGQLAFLAGSPGAARAVGRVMSLNLFPLIVPCHRVIGADGSLGNYTAASGCRTKAWLLDFERRHAAGR